MKPNNRRPLYRMLAVLVAVLTALGFAAPAQAAAPVILHATDWWGGNGVAVCGASTDTTCDGETHVGGWSGNWWQCVELAQRFYKKRGWYGGIFSGIDYAYQIYDNASSLGMSRQANGSITSIVPGDMIVHTSGLPGSGGAGHVAIVDSVSGSTINVVEQNWSSTGRATYTLSGGSLTRGSTGYIAGVVHDPDNPITPPNGSTYQSFMADVNGDNVVDLGLRNVNTGVFYIRYGPSFSGQTVFQWDNSVSNYQSFVGDFNGDNIVDVGLRNPNTGTFFTRYGPDFTSSGQTYFTWDNSQPNYQSFMADVNGDGVVDLGLRNPTTGTFFVRYGPGYTSDGQTVFVWDVG